MSVSQPPSLEFPEMLHGPTGAIVRKLGDKGQRWGREYLETGGFTQPRRMRQVLPGELLIMHSAADPDITPRPRWRIHIFLKVYRHLNEGVPREKSQRMNEVFESFCLNTPWGALYHSVSPLPPRSAECMAQRLAALLRFWDVLQGPRYGYRVPNTHHTLDELMEYLHGMALEAWCPGNPAPVRERMALMVERMSRAPREECTEAVIRMSSSLVRVDARLKHRERLGDPDFLRERLTALPPKDWEDVSSANRYTVSELLSLWDREL